MPPILINFSTFQLDIVILFMNYSTISHPPTESGGSPSVSLSTSYSLCSMLTFTCQISYETALPQTANFHLFLFSSSNPLVLAPGLWPSCRTISNRSPSLASFPPTHPIIPASNISRFSLGSTSHTVREAVG